MKRRILAAIFASGLSLTAASFAQDPTIECIAEVHADPRTQILWSKMPFDVTKGQPLEVLASKERPTPEESAALSVLATEGERCFDLGEKWRQENYPTEVNAVLTTYRVDALLALADLYGGSITYGEMARTRARLAADLKNRVDAVAAKIKAQREAEAAQRQELATARNEADRQAQQQIEFQREQARRQAALQMFLKPNLLSMPQVPRTQNTNCTAFGNQVNCTTR